MSNQSDIFRPLVPPRNLKDELINRLTGEIKSGTLKPNQKLPTEQEMIAAFGVSRTVVREALAALRAEGLIDTRQGAGAFVSGDNSRRPFRIPAEGVQNISDVIRIIELRLGIEIEAAGLAAERRTVEDMKLIDQTVEQFGLSIKQGDEAVEADFNIHQAIAKATHNQHFVTFLDFLGWQIIPRRNIYAKIVDHGVRRKYLLRVHNEHKSIAKAISDSRPNAARNAMRRHLEKSLKRYVSIGKDEPKII
jgi:DNA-binding FadR family transcriptional regulator